MTLPKLNTRTILILAISILAGLALTPQADFGIFWNAGLAARLGQNPYSIPGFFSPLHVLIYFIPLSFLPEPIVYHLNATLTIFILLISLGKRWALALLSPSLWAVAWFGNVDWLPVLALIVPATWIAPLALAKPQIGWLEALLSRRVLPLLFMAGIFIVSFALGMNWSTVQGSSWNISLWPWGIPIGLFLARVAILKRQPDLALAATPFLSPYLSPLSYIAWLPMATRSIWLMAIVLSIQWAITLVWLCRP